MPLKLSQLDIFVPNVTWEQKMKWQWTVVFTCRPSKSQNKKTMPRNNLTSQNFASRPNWAPEGQVPTSSCTHLLDQFTSNDKLLTLLARLKDINKWLTIHLVLLCCMCFFCLVLWFAQQQLNSFWMVKVILSFMTLSAIAIRHDWVIIGLGEAHLVDILFTPSITENLLVNLTFHIIQFLMFLTCMVAAYSIRNQSNQISQYDRITFSNEQNVWDWRWCFNALRPAVLLWSFLDWKVKEFKLEVYKFLIDL